MQVECPNCGYHLLDVATSQNEDFEQFVFSQTGAEPPTTETPDPARHSFSEPDKRTDRDGKSALRSTLTKYDIKEIRILYEKGLSLPRIRQTLNLDVSLNRLQTVVNKPW